MSDPQQKKTFQGAQKLLAILLCFFEAAVFVFFARIAIVDSPLFGSVLITQLLIILQISLGSLILLFLDEVVSKHGIGSGISLFIAAGVSFSIVGGSLGIFGGMLTALSSGSAEALPNAIISLLPLFFTVLVFMVVAYAEGIKVEIPLAFDRARGLGSRFPIKFLYVSNIPVILASALLLNVQFFAVGLSGQHLCIGGQYTPGDSLNPCPGGFDLVHAIAYVGADKQMHDGLLYLLSPIYRPLQGN
ncbi:MAG: preprotein translocase subunit SecY, partial [Candidatus Micrarchaeota archaeon]|nr:preprotein translocase subunit SecY [Candidatus Micrarchaeota archaeon]